jgi:hypothetical protein
MSISIMQFTRLVVVGASVVEATFVAVTEVCLTPEFP